MSKKEKMDKIESCFYVDYHNYDFNNLTEIQRGDCVRQGSQLHKQIIAGKDTPTIKFFKYWKKDYLFDGTNGKAILKNPQNNDDNGVMEDGLLIVKVEELKVYNKYDNETQNFDEHQVQCLLKMIDEKNDKIQKLEMGAGITDYAILKEKHINLERRHKHFQEQYKKKCEDYNKIKLKGTGKGAVDALIKELDELKERVEWYFQRYGAVKTEVDI